MTKLGESLLQSIDEARAIARCQAKPSRALVVTSPDVAAIHKRLKLSQGKFAERFHLPAASVRDWEQGRRTPDAAAQNLLKVIDYAPETVVRALGEGQGVMRPKESGAVK